MKNRFIKDCAKMECFVTIASTAASSRRQLAVCCREEQAVTVSRRDFIRFAGTLPLWGFAQSALAAGSLPLTPEGGTAVAVFAGGCFWCMEKPFDVLPGVISTTSGYCGGDEKNPTYNQVGSGRTGHAESVRVEYDPKVISYEELLDVFWHNIDPTTKNRQFCDPGKQYRSAIFFIGEEQKKAAEMSKKKYNESGIFGKDIVTEISSCKVRSPVIY